MNTIISKNMFTVEMSMNNQLYNELLVTFERAKYSNTDHHVKPDTETLKSELEKAIDSELMNTIEELTDDLNGNETYVKDNFNHIYLAYVYHDTDVKQVIKIHFEVTEIINNNVYVNATKFETWTE